MKTSEIEEFVGKVLMTREDVVDIKPFKDDYVLSFDHGCVAKW